MRVVGNYGVAIQFSDGHGTGVYRFASYRSDSGESSDDSAT
jgi:DUF971 family protein